MAQDNDKIDDAFDIPRVDWSKLNLTDNKKPVDRQNRFTPPSSTIVITLLR